MARMIHSVDLEASRAVLLLENHGWDDSDSESDDDEDGAGGDIDSDEDGDGDGDKDDAKSTEAAPAESSKTAKSKRNRRLKVDVDLTVNAYTNAKCALASSVSCSLARQLLACRRLFFESAVASKDCVLVQYSSAGMHVAACPSRSSALQSMHVCVSAVGLLVRELTPARSGSSVQRPGLRSRQRNRMQVGAPVQQQPCLPRQHNGNGQQTSTGLLLEPPVMCLVVCQL